MSRHTHVTDSHRHDRGELRRQRVRWARRHWRDGKRHVGAHTLEFRLDSPQARQIDPACVEQLKAHLGQDGPVLYLQPEQMRQLPADLRRCFEPFTRQCTELHAPAAAPDPSGHPRPASPRARQKRLWAADADAQLV